MAWLIIGQVYGVITGGVHPKNSQELRKPMDILSDSINSWRSCHWMIRDRRTNTLSQMGHAIYCSL
jgi:hypothetical protein